MPSVGGNITAQSVQPQGEISEEGRKKIILISCNLQNKADKSISERVKLSIKNRGLKF